MCSCPQSLRHDNSVCTGVCVLRDGLSVSPTSWLKCWCEVLLWLQVTLSLSVQRMSSHYSLSGRRGYRMSSLLVSNWLIQSAGGSRRKGEQERRCDLNKRKKEGESKKSSKLVRLRERERRLSTSACRCGAENKQQKFCSHSPSLLLSPLNQPSIPLFFWNKQQETQPTAKVQLSPLSCV